MIKEHFFTFLLKTIDRTIVFIYNIDIKNKGSRGDSYEKW